MILVAKKALEAYLINSAPLLEVLKYLLFFLVIGLYKDFNILFAFTLSVPIITLSGLEKSLIASPSLKNSGLETISTNLFFFNLIKIFSIWSPVVTGTVDFVTIILYFDMRLLNSFATLKTYFKSAELFFF